MAILTPRQKIVFDFISDNKPSSDISKYKKIYQDFLKYNKTKEDIKFDEFEEIILDLKNYYFLITPDYNLETKEYKSWIIRKRK